MVVKTAAENVKFPQKAMHRVSALFLTDVGLLCLLGYINLFCSRQMLTVAAPALTKASKATYLQTSRAPLQNREPVQKAAPETIQRHSERNYSAPAAEHNLTI